MLFAPPPPSSAGWNTRCTVPLHDVSLRQQRRGAEQRRGVAVMAAGVHHAGIGGGVGDAGGLGDRQRVHVGTQADAAIGCRRGDRRHHAMAADAGDEAHAKFAQPSLDEGGGLLFVQRQFRDVRAGGGAMRSASRAVSCPWCLQPFTRADECRPRCRGSAGSCPPFPTPGWWRPGSRPDPGSA